jgi:hypothetical protein
MDNMEIKRTVARTARKIDRNLSDFKKKASDFWCRYYAIIISCAVLLVTITASSFVTIAITNYKNSHSIWDLNRDKMYVEYTVRYGDTLWSIAEDMMTVNPEYRDIRDYVWEVRQTNNLYGDIKAGQTIMLPYYTVTDPDKVDIYNYYQLKPIIVPAFTTTNNP